MKNKKMSVCVFLSVCGVFACLMVCKSAYISVSVWLRLWACLTVSLPRLPVYLSPVSCLTAYLSYSVCLPDCLFVFLSVPLSVWLNVFACLPVWLSASLPGVSMSAWLCFCLSGCLFVCLPVCLAAFGFYLSAWPYVPLCMTVPVCLSV